MGEALGPIPSTTHTTSRSFLSFFSDGFPPIHRKTRGSSLLPSRSLHGWSEGKCHPWPWAWALPLLQALRFLREQCLCPPDPEPLILSWTRPWEIIWLPQHWKWYDLGLNPISGRFYKEQQMYCLTVQPGARLPEIEAPRAMCNCVALDRHVISVHLSHV